MGGEGQLKGDMLHPEIRQPYIHQEYGAFGV